MPRPLVSTFATMALLALPAAAATPPTLSVDGLGGVRIGMTIKEVRRVVGPMDIGYLNGPECGEAHPKRPWIPGVGFMVSNGRLVRIDVVQDQPPAPKQTTKTDTGIGIGSTIADVRRAYGKHLKIEPHPYDNEDGRYL